MDRRCLALGRRRPLATLAAVVLPAVIAIAPLAIRNLVATGDPFEFNTLGSRVEQVWMSGTRVV